MNLKKSIHFILPSGGVKGSFQAGFLYCLYTYFSEYFTTYQIDGCSAGTINGIITMKNPLKLKEFWYSIKTLEDIFCPISNMGKLVWLYNGFYRRGFYDTYLLNKRLDVFSNSTDNYVSPEKFNCVVTNISKGTYQYINGTHDKICSYAIASASPWIMCPPIKIEEDYYTDGALLSSYPIDNINISEADLKVIICDKTHFQKTGLDNDKNLIYFLSDLINICRANNINSWNMTQILNYSKLRDDFEIVQNTMTDNPMNFKKEIIDIGFKKGEKAALRFALKHFQLSGDLHYLVT